MKKFLFLKSIPLFAILITGCNGNSSSTTGKSSSEIITTTVTSSSSSSSSTTSSSQTSSSVKEKHFITFVSENEIVYSVEAIEGTYVDIPVVQHKTNKRYIVKTWTGITEEEMELGKVLVGTKDATYEAVWTEKFGTDVEYETKKIRSEFSITCDGTKDVAYDDCTPIDISEVSTGSSTTTAQMYSLWDSQNIYIFVEVKDSTLFTYQSDKAINHGDSLILSLDLLHDYCFESNPSPSWGSEYRGDTGPMCEGTFNIAAGVSYNETTRYGLGSEFGYDWLSNAAKLEGCKTFGTTKTTTDGYNVEYRIDLTNPYIPDYCIPDVDKMIGIGINIYDKNESAQSSVVAPNTVSIEDINIEMGITPKRLSNFRCVKNEFDTKKIIEATKIRDTYKINNLNEKDLPFKDAAIYEVGGDLAQFIWTDDKIYSYFEKGLFTESVKIESDYLPDQEITFYNDKKVIFNVPSLHENSYIDMKVTSTEDDETFINEFRICCKNNTNNFESARKLFSGMYTDGETIQIDGIKDEKYNDATMIPVTTLSNGATSVTASSYVLWDDSYIYVFIDIIDDNVYAYSPTEPTSNPEQKDSAALWLSTCESMPNKDDFWGTSNRPYKNYCGEGGFRLRALDTGNHLSGLHYMFDNSSVTKEAYSAETTNGYTVEFKIGWGTFESTIDKENHIIDFGINVNDGSLTRNGVVSTNTEMADAYNKPYYLDHLLLEK